MNNITLNTTLLTLTLLCTQNSHAIIAGTYGAITKVAAPNAVFYTAAGLGGASFFAFLAGVESLHGSGDYGDPLLKLSGILVAAGLLTLDSSSDQFRLNEISDSMMDRFDVSAEDAFVFNSEVPLINAWAESMSKVTIENKSELLQVTDEADWFRNNLSMQTRSVFIKLARFN